MISQGSHPGSEPRIVIAYLFIFSVMARLRSRWRVSGSQWRVRRAALPSTKRRIRPSSTRMVRSSASTEWSKRRRSRLIQRPQRTRSLSLPLCRVRMHSWNGGGIEVEWEYYGAKSKRSHLLECCILCRDQKSIGTEASGLFSDDLLQVEEDCFQKNSRV